MPQLIHRNLVRHHSSRMTLRVFYTIGRPVNNVNPWNGELIMSRTVFPNEYLATNFVGLRLNENCPYTTLTENLDDFYIVVESIARRMARGSGIETAVIRQIYDDVYDSLSDGVSDFRIQLLLHLIRVHQIPVTTIIYWYEGNREHPIPIRIRDFLNDWDFLPPYNFQLPRI